MGSASAAPNGEFGTVVNLADEGLTSGDEIDPYIEQHFVSGNEVHIPPGEYEWNGTLEGPSSGDAALVGDGDIGSVVFNVNQQLTGNFSHDSGTVLFRNVTFSGENPNPKAGIEFSVSGELRFEHIRAPDGATQPEDRFLYASSDHDGVAYVRNCYWAGFGNNGAYTDNGRVVYENCVAHNNNIAGFRIGIGDSEVYNSLIILDGDIPTDGQNSANARGIRVREPGNHIIENCDFVYRGVSGAGSPLELRASETSGVMRNCRIQNETGQPIVRNKSDNQDWTVENTHISGSGNLEMEGVSQSSIVSGSSADAPRTDFAEFLGAPIDVSANDSTSGSTEDSSSTPDDYENVLSLHASPDNSDQNLDVSVTVSGDADYASESEPDTDQIVSNDDGTTTLTSVEMDPDALDSYMFDGEVLDYQVTDGYTVDVSLNGSMTTFEELVGEVQTDDSSSSDDGSTDNSSSDGSSSDDTSGDTSSGQDSSGDTSSGQDSTDDGTSGDDSSSGGTSSDGSNDDATSGDSSSGDSSSEDSSSGDSSSEDSSSGDSSSEDSSSGDSSSGDDSSGGSADEDLPNELVVDSRNQDEVTTYTMTVSGDIQKDTASSSGNGDFDKVEDVARDGKVIGLVHKGTDVYRYCGEVTNVTIDGSADVTFWGL